MHLACLGDTVSLVNSLPMCAKFLMLAGDPAAAQRFARNLGLSSSWKCSLQQGRDLGARLDNAFRQLWRSGAQRVVVVGIDSPWMGARRIREAFAALRNVDVVIGPTVDGGYYLIGARKPVPRIFDGISWGTGRVLSQSLLTLRKARLSYRLLFRDFDLDKPGDLARVRGLCERGWCKSPELEKWLRR